MITLTSIGTVSSPRTEPIDDDWDAIEARIELDAEQFGAEALAGLTDFSHIEVLFHIHLADESTINTGARHPRGREDWPKVGIFAQRGKDRPNRLGSCVCLVLGVKGTSLLVHGLDAIDGTPVLDIKPYMTGFGPRGTIREPDWATEIMKDYWGT